METKKLYYEDAYQKEFNAKVLQVNGTNVVLDQTLFYDTQKSGDDCIHILKLHSASHFVYYLFIEIFESKDEEIITAS